MKKSVIALIAAVSVIGVSASAIAAMNGGHGMRGMGGMHGMMMSDGPVKLADIEAKVKTHFAEVDTNKDGFIVETEISAMRDKKRDERQANHFTGMDSNKDGTISRAEFDAAHEKRMGETGHGGHRMGHHGGHDARGPGGNVPGMFGRADTDKDGKISLAEALAMPTEHFKAMDANKDGTVTPEEHKAAREKMRANWKAKREG